MSEVIITKSQLEEFAKFSDPQNQLLAAVALAALHAQQKLNALLAENKILDSAIGAIADAYETGITDVLVKEIDTAVNTETPATDSILNTVRAEGVDMLVADKVFEWMDSYREDAHKFANQLRAGNKEGAPHD